MAITYPTSLDALTNPVGTNTLDSPDHATQHSNANDILEALESKVGLGAGTPTANTVLVGSGNGTATWSGTWNNATMGSPTITGGTINTATLGTPVIVALNAGTSAITNVVDPTNAQDAATKKYVDDNAGAGGKYELIIPGALGTGTNMAGIWYAPLGFASVTALTMYAETAGATGTTIIDVNLNGTTIYGTATKPNFVGTVTSYVGTPVTTAGTAGDQYTVDVDQITTTAQQTVHITFYYA